MQPKDFIEPLAEAAANGTLQNNNDLSIPPFILATWQGALRAQQAELNGIPEVRQHFERNGPSLYSARHRFEKLLQWDRVWDVLYNYVDDRSSDTIDV